MSSPDLWSLIELTPSSGEKITKIIASYYGGFTGSDSWRISSGVCDAKRDDGDHEPYQVKNNSGSIYFCYPNAYGMSGFTSMVYSHYDTRLSEEGTTTMRLLPEEEAIQYLETLCK